MDFSTHLGVFNQPGRFIFFEDGDVFFEHYCMLFFSFNVKVLRMWCVCVCVKHVFIVRAHYFFFFFFFFSVETHYCILSGNSVSQ